MKFSVGFFLIIFYVAASWAPGLLDINGDISASFIFVPMIMAMPFLSVAMRSSGEVGVFVRGWAGGGAGWAILLASFLIVVISLISALNVDNLFRIMRGVYGYIAGFVLFYAIVRWAGSLERMVFLVKLSIACAVISSLIAAAGYWIPSLKGVLFADADRTASLFKHQNQFGMALSATAPFAIGWLFFRRGFVLQAMALTIIFMGVVFSGSKTNMGIFALSLVFGCFIFSFLLSGWKRMALSVILPVVVIAALPLAIYALEQLNPRALRILTMAASGDLDDVQSFASRLNLWSYSIQAGVNNFWSGEGVGTSVYGYNHSHNVLLDYFRTLGFPGLFFITTLVFSVLWLAVQNITVAVRKNSAALTVRVSLIAASISMVSYIFSNMLSDSFGPWTQFLLWFSLAISVVCRRLIFK